MTQSNNTTTIFPSLTGYQLGELGIGAWAWGNDFFWGQTSDEDITQAFKASLDGGITFFDTAEIYALGQSETHVGRLTGSLTKKPFIATKFFPLPWRVRNSSVIEAARRSLKRLQANIIDLYQIHQPSPFKADKWVTGMGMAVQAGLVKYAGVSNFSVAQTRAAYELLAEKGIPLISNQVHYSLLRRNIECSGLLDMCHSLGITIISYSPLAQGMLTGKYGPDNPPPGIRSRRYSPERLSQIQPLVERLREIGQAHGGKTPGQVAVNWTICKGTYPIPGARNAHQATELCGAAGWRLTADEVTELDNLSQKYSSPASFS